MKKYLIILLWITTGLVGRYLINEVVYLYLNKPNMGVNLLTAFLPAIGGTVFMIFCFFKVFTTYKNNDLTIFLPEKYHLKVLVVVGLYVMVVFFTKILTSTNTSVVESSSLTPKSVSNVKKTVFDVYTCESNKDMGTSKSTPDCDSYTLTRTEQFKVNKEKSEVFLQTTSVKNNESKLIKLKGCEVFDEMNWICRDPSVRLPGNNGFAIISGGDNQMVDGIPSNTPIKIEQYSNNKLIETSYIPAKIYK